MMAKQKVIEAEPTAREMEKNLGTSNIPESQGTFVKGFSLAGEEVKNMKDKHFTIILPPYYEIIPDINDPANPIEKLILELELAQDKVQVKYYPNKTSQKVIMAARGRDYTKWLGFTGEFFTVQQKVGKEMREVIYIK